MDVINHGYTSRAAELFDLADDLNMQVYEMMEILEKVQDTLDKLMALYPDSLNYEDEKEFESNKE